jgi:hypothetical protein
MMIILSPRPLAPPATVWERLCDVLRGTVRLVWFVATACWALLTALVGFPLGVVSRAGHLLADEYRAGRLGALDVEVTDTPQTPDTRTVPDSDPGSADRARGRCAP